MIKFIANVLTLAMVAHAALVAGPADAQTTQSANGTGLANLQAAITKSIGAQDKAVEITLTDRVLTALRVNSNLNGSSHDGRNNEAIAIADLASDAIGKTPEFTGVHTIKVQYIERSAANSATIIDTVEFRKNAKGIFEIHLS